MTDVGESDKKRWRIDVKIRLFGRKEHVKARLIAWLFREKNGVSQEANKTGNGVETATAVDLPIATTDVAENSEAVPEENASIEMTENAGTEETEFCDADHTAEDLPVEDSLATDSRYDVNGFDCAGFTQQYYRKAVDSLLNRVCKAGKQMQEGNYEYAVFGAKTAVESAVRMLLCHNGLTTGRMEEDIDACKRYGLITDEMANRLHGVRLLGNFNGHSFYAPENLTHGQAYFAIMQALDLISEIETQLLWPEPLPELSAEWSREQVEIKNIMAEDSEEERQ